MKKIIFTILLVPFLSVSFAQDFVDNALLFSRIQQGGSARIQALGGAQTALGGDYSAALSNPAGLGMFNRTEFTFSLGINSNQTSTNYLDNDSHGGRVTPVIPGFSFVQKHPVTKGKYLGGAFAFSFTRVNNFNSQIFYEGDNSQNSLIDYFLDDAYGRKPKNMFAGGSDFYNLTALAYNNYLIEDNPAGSTTYGSILSPLPADPAKNIPAEVRTVHQSEDITRTGAQRQLTIAYGGNYDDVLFFGASVGFASIRFKQRQIFTEKDFRYNQSPFYKPLNDFSSDETFDIQGNGINLTLGAIYRPIDFFQVGFSLATPTLYDLTDSYNASLKSSWNQFDYYGDGKTILGGVSEKFDVPLISEYSITTPTRLHLGATFISKYGFITADVESVNYGKTSYSTKTAGQSYQYENNNIKARYNSVVNYRLGAEFRYDIFRVRGGFNYMPDPYRTTSVSDRTIIGYSSGVGIRTSTFYVDVTYAHSSTEKSRIPYPASPSPQANQKINTTNIIVTLGFPF